MPFKNPFYEEPEEQGPVGQRLDTWGSEQAAPSAASPRSAPMSNDAYVDVLGYQMSRGDLAKTDEGRALLQIQRRNQRGRRGYGEAITDVGVKDLPFIGDIAGGTLSLHDTYQVADTFKKLADNEEVDTDDLVKAALFQADQERKAQATKWGMAGDISRAMPGFALETGAYMLAAGSAGTSVGPVGTVVGAAGAGLRRVGTRVARNLVVKRARRAMGKLVTGVAGKKAASRLPGYMTKVAGLSAAGAAAGAAHTVLDTGLDAAANVARGHDALASRAGAERAVQQAMETGDYDIDQANWMALGDELIERMSEQQGRAIGAALAPAGRRVMKATGRLTHATASSSADDIASLGKEMAEEYNRLFATHKRVNFRNMSKAQKRAVLAAREQGLSRHWLGRYKPVAATAMWLTKKAQDTQAPLERYMATLKKMGYDGFIEEMMEERWGGFMRGLFGMDGDDAGVREAFRSAGWDSSDQFWAEVIAFATPVAAANAIHQGHMGLAGNTMTEFTRQHRNLEDALRPAASTLPVLEYTEGEAGLAPEQAAQVPEGRATIQSGVDSIVKLHKTQEGRPKTVPLKILDHALTVAEMIATGSLAGHQNYRAADALLAEAGKPALISTYGNVKSQAKAKALEKGAPEAEAEAQAEQAARRVVGEQLAALRGSKAVSQEQLRAAAKEAGVDLDKTAPEETVEALNKLAASPDSRIARQDISDRTAGFSHSIYFVRPKEGIANPVSEAVSEMHSLLESVANKSGFRGTLIDLDGSPDAQFQSGLQLDLDDAALAEIERNPTSLDAWRLATIMPGVDLASSHGLEAVVETARRLRKQLRGRQVLRFKEASEGGKEFSVSVSRTGNGMFSIEGLDTESRAQMASSGTVLNRVVNEAKQLQRDYIKGSEAGAEAPYDALFRMAKAAGLSYDTYDVELAAGAPVVVQTSDPRKLARRAVSMGYGISMEEANNEGEAASLIQRVLGARKNPETGKWTTTFGALNTIDHDNQTVTVTAAPTADGYDLWEDSTEATLKAVAALSRDPRAVWTPAMVPFFDNLERRLGRVQSEEKSGHAADLRRLLERDSAGNIKPNLEIVPKLFGTLRLGYTVMPNSSAPYRNSIYQLRDVIANTPGYTEFVQEMESLIGVPYGSNPLQREESLREQMSPSLPEDAVAELLEPPISEPKAPVEEKAPAEPKAPVEEKAPAEPKAPVEEKAPAEPKAPVEEKAPDGLLAAMARDTPAEDRFDEQDPLVQEILGSEDLEGEHDPDAALEWLDDDTTASVAEYAVAHPMHVARLQRIIQLTDLDRKLDKKTLLEYLGRLGLTEAQVVQLYREARELSRVPAEERAERLRELRAHNELDYADDSMSFDDPGIISDETSKNARIEGAGPVSLFKSAAGMLFGESQARYMLDSFFRHMVAEGQLQDIESKALYDAESFSDWVDSYKFSTAEDRKVAQVLKILGYDFTRTLVDSAATTRITPHQELVFRTMPDGSTVLDVRNKTASTQTELVGLRNNAERSVREGAGKFHDAVESLARSWGFDIRTDVKESDVAGARTAVDALAPFLFGGKDSELSNTIRTKLSDDADMDTRLAVASDVRSLAHRARTVLNMFTKPGQPWSLEQAQKLAHAVVMARTAPARQGDSEPRTLPSPGVILLQTVRGDRPALSVITPEGKRIHSAKLSSVLLSKADAMEEQGLQLVSLTGVTRREFYEESDGQGGTLQLESEDRREVADDSGVSPAARASIMRDIYEDAAQDKVLFIPFLGEKEAMYGVWMPRSLAEGASGFEDAYSRMSKEFTKFFPQWFKAFDALSLSKRIGMLSSGGKALTLGTKGGFETKEDTSIHTLVLEEDFHMDGSAVALSPLAAKIRSATNLPDRSILKAHWMSESDQGLSLLKVKTVMQDVHENDPSYERDVLVALSALGDRVDLFTDKGGAKSIPADAVKKTITVNGQEVTGWLFPVPVTDLYETTNLDYVAQTTRENVPSPVGYDAPIPGVLAAMAERTNAYADYVESKGGIEAVLGTEGIVEIIDRPELAALLEAGVPTSAPYIRGLVDTVLASKVRKDGTRVKAAGIHSQALPSGGVAEVDADGNISKVLWGAGVIDTHLAPPTDVGGRVRSGWMRTNVVPARRGPRVWQERDAVLYFDGSLEELKSMLQQWKKEAKVSTPEDNEIQRALQLKLVYDTPDGSEQHPQNITFADLFGQDGRLLEHELGIAGPGVLDGSGRPFVPGTLRRVDRTPGGPSAHVFERVMSPVSWIKDPRNGRWVPGRAGVDKRHPGTILKGGVDYDGDSHNQQAYSFNEYGEIDYAAPNAAEGLRALVRRAETRAANKIMAAGHEHQMSRGSASEVQAMLDVHRFDDVTLAPHEGHTVGEVAGGSSGDLDIHDLGVRLMLEERVQASVKARGLAVSLYGGLQYLFGTGGASLVGKPFTVAGVEFNPESLRDPEYAAANYDLTRLAMGDILNIIIDDVKHGKASLLHLTEADLPAVTAMLLMSDHKGDVRGSMQKIVDVLGTPDIKESPEFRPVLDTAKDLRGVVSALVMFDKPPRSASEYRGEARTLKLLSEGTSAAPMGSQSRLGVGGMAGSSVLERSLRVARILGGSVYSSTRNPLQTRMAEAVANTKGLRMTRAGESALSRLMDRASLVESAMHPLFGLKGMENLDPVPLRSTKSRKNAKYRLQRGLMNVAMAAYAKVTTASQVRNPFLEVLGVESTVSASRARRPRRFQAHVSRDTLTPAELEQAKAGFLSMPKDFKAAGIDTISVNKGSRKVEVPVEMLPDIFGALHTLQYGAATSEAGGNYFGLLPESYVSQLSRRAHEFHQKVYNSGNKQLLDAVKQVFLRTAGGEVAINNMYANGSSLLYRARMPKEQSTDAEYKAGALIRHALRKGMPETKESVVDELLGASADQGATAAVPAQEQGAVLQPKASLPAAIRAKETAKFTVPAGSQWYLVAEAGNENSSTAEYMGQAVGTGNLVNEDTSFQAGDIVLTSSEGRRANRYSPINAQGNLTGMYARLTEALDAGAVVRTDVTATQYNEGESELRNALRKLGYVETKQGQFSEWRAASVAQEPVDQGASAPAASESIDINTVSEYKGIPVRREAPRPHPVHGGVSGASLRTDADGNRYINIVPTELARQFREKQWTKPRTPGVTPLAADAFADVNQWTQFILEHELQHTNFPRVPPQDGAEAYAANENAINQAALEALGLSQDQAAEVQDASAGAIDTTASIAGAPSPDLMLSQLGFAASRHYGDGSGIVRTRIQRGIRDQFLNRLYNVNRTEDAAALADELLDNVQGRTGRLTDKQKGDVRSAVRKFAEENAQMSREEVAKRLADRAEVDFVPDELTETDEAMGQHAGHYNPAVAENRSGLMPGHVAPEAEQPLTVQTMSVSGYAAVRDMYTSTFSSGAAGPRIQKIIDDELKWAADHRTLIDMELGRLYLDWAVDGWLKEYDDLKLADGAKGLPVLSRFRVGRQLDKADHQDILLVQDLVDKALENLVPDKQGRFTEQSYKDALDASLVWTGIPVGSEDLLRTVAPNLAEELIARKKAIDEKYQGDSREVELARAEAYERNRIAMFRLRKDSRGRERASGVVWTIPGDTVVRNFAKSNVRKELLKAGRDPGSTTPEALLKTVKESYDRYRKDVNDHMPYLASVDGPFIRYLERYSPRITGPMGFVGGLEQSAQDRIAAAVRGRRGEAAKRMEAILDLKKDRGESVRTLDDVSDNMLKYLFDLKGIGYVNRRQAVDTIRSNDPVNVDNGLHDGMTYADVVQEINRELVRVMTERAVQQQELNEPVGSVEDPAALLRAVSRASFETREFSPRTLRRTTSARDYAELYDLTGKLPANLGALDKLSRYASDVHAAALQRAAMNQVVLATDPRGMPVVFVDPDMEFEGTEFESILTPEVWERVAQRAADYFRRGYIDPKKSAKQNYHDIIHKEIATRPKNFRPIESPYPSIAKVYALSKGAQGETLLDLMSGGEIAGMLKHAFDRRSEDPYGVIRTAENLNSASKLMAMQASLFFLITGQESLAAGVGPIRYLKDGGPVAWVKVRSMIKARDPRIMHMLKLAQAAGVTQGSIDNVLSMRGGFGRGFSKKVASFMRSVGFSEKQAKMTGEIAQMPRKQTETLFDSFLNSAKLYMFMAHYKDMQQRMAENGNPNWGTEEDVARDMKWVGHYIDQEMGGSRYSRYSWMTPTARRNSNFLMFSTQWTITAANAAGLGLFTGPILKNYMTPEEAKFIVWRRIPRMFATVLVGLPAVVQAATYATSLLAGGGSPDDDDDRLLTLMNEAGRKMHADVTPLVRLLPGYKGEPTGRRRYYMRWGKQLFEAGRWLDDPWKAFKSKLSQTARWGIEQATGEAVGVGWDLGFKDQGLVGMVVDKDGGIAGSRVGHTIGKFMPFSVLSWARSPDAKALHILGSVSKGMSYYRAIEAYQGVLETWSRRDTYSKVYNNPRVKANLEALSDGILDAVERNGYEPKKVIDTAKAGVTKVIYAKMFRALNREDTKEVEDLARQLHRLNGTVNNLRRSVRSRNRNYGHPAVLTEQQNELIREAFSRP